jgi:hypothetical protein
MARTITSEGRQKGKAKERSKDVQPAGPKKKKKRVSPSRGRKLSHSQPSNVSCMQIMRSNSNEI